MFVKWFSGYSEALTVYDLAGDWSDVNNPNSPWSYNDGPGSPITTHWDNWDSTGGIQQPAWAATQFPNQGHVPVWFKSVTGGITDFESGIGVPVGRVGMHGTSGTSSLVNTPAGVTWTRVVDIKE